MRRKTIAAVALVLIAAGAGGYLYVFERPWLLDRLSGPEARTELVPRACGFTTESGRTMVCYDLYVPENRARIGGRLIKLPILVFEAPERPKHEDPVLLIGGGPGAIAYTEKRFAEMWKGKFKDLPWLQGRDLIVYDQRGVGGARPALECPEIDATRDDPMNLDRAKSAMIACRDRLAREGNDLLAYDTNANADDVLSIKAKFGAKSLILWGQSYGTRVALTVMRRNPAGVRGAILDGAYPPEVAGRLNMASAFTDTLERIFDACEKDEECRADYPDFRRRFEQVVEQLRAQPAAVKSDPSPLLPPKVFQVNDVIFLSIVDSLLYTADGVAKLPWIVDRIADGRPEALTEPIADWDQVSYGPFVTAGISYLVDCNDTPDPDDSEERSAARRLPHLAPWLNYALAVKPCPIWSPRKAPALDRAPIRSEIPTLVVSGWFDIATPPEWAIVTARSLARAQLVLVRAASHDASDQSCAQSALAAFLAEPDRDLSHFCGPAPSHPRFKRKSDEE
ncbi:MAG TPA: alpha/beta fold hydrolase [Alphaproteobacteria bacterium]|jgi:pimeloyl-ACP methyl ester carboxylesterase